MYKYFPAALLLITLCYNTMVISDGLSTSSSNATPTRPIRGILFDMDGTLLDTETLGDVAIIHVLQQHGVAVPRDVVESQRIPWELKYQTLGLRGADWIPLVLNYAKEHWMTTTETTTTPESTLPTMEEFWEHWEHYLHEELAPTVKALPGATTLVQACAEHGIPMAIATSSRMHGVNKKRIPHEESIFRHLQVIVAGDDVENGKPAPDIYLEAARRMNIDPQECLVFEDATAGCQSGQAAGCAVVAIPDTRFSESQKKELFGPYTSVILESLEEFDGLPFGLPVQLSKAQEAATQ